MAEKNAVYRSTVTEDLFEVVETPDAFASDPDNEQVELVRLDDGEWFGVYADNFRSGYEFVADSVEDVEEVEA